MLEVQVFAGTNLIALSLFALAMVGAVVLIYLNSRGAKKNESLLDELVLGERQQNHDGYTSVTDKSKFLGSIGVCVTDLRPAGTITVDGEPLDVVAEGSFVKAGAQVKVINVDGSRVLVRSVEC